MNTTPSGPTLTTEHLILRQFEEDDWRAVHEYASDPEVVRCMPWGPNTEEESREFVRRAMAAAAEMPRLKYDFAILLHGSTRLIGACGIYLGEDARQANIGYVLNRAFWGKGYGTEAARAFLNFGFGELKLHRITAACDVLNKSSARVMEKIGMRREGLMRQDVWEKGEWRDSLYYAILAEEWTQ
jgi:RimJ/RimL family protein N-acetyltransferase